MCLGDHAIKTYSKQQKVVALSSAEAELYAMVLASAETMAVQAYAQDLGLTLASELYTDSSAALGIAKRAGIGKVRHLRTQGLCIQEVRVSGRIVYKKVLGEKNPSDLFTKYMSAELSLRHLTAICARFVAGRAETAPGISSIEDTVEALRNDGGDGGIESWVRKFIGESGRRVRFRQVVEMRPIPAVGHGKSCRGPGRTCRRGRWQPKLDNYNLEDEQHSGMESLQRVDVVSFERPEGELEPQIDGDIDRENGGTAGGSRSHDPRQPAVHVCGIGRRCSWQEALSDSEDEIVECAACREACEQLESPGQAPSRWRALELADTCSLEIGSGKCDRKERASGGHSDSEDEDYVCTQVDIIAPGFSGERLFRPVREGHVFASRCRERSIPLGIELPLGQRPLGHFLCGSGRASIEGTTVRPAIAPASSGCIPAGHCTSFDNSCCIVPRVWSVGGRHHISGHVTKGERQRTSLSLALTRTHTYTCAVTLLSDHASSALPCSHSRMQMYRVMNPDLYRIRGSSPL